MDVEMWDRILFFALMAIGWFTLPALSIAWCWFGILSAQLRGQHAREMAFLAQHPRLELVPMGQGA